VEPSSSITTGHTRMLIAESLTDARLSSRFRLRTSRTIRRNPIVHGLRPAGNRGPGSSGVPTRSIRFCALAANGCVSSGSSPRHMSSARFKDHIRRRFDPLKLPGRSPPLGDDFFPDPFPDYGPQ
jgi:hypothetical protein